MAKKQKTRSTKNNCTLKRIDEHGRLKSTTGIVHFPKIMTRASKTLVVDALIKNINATQLKLHKRVKVRDINPGKTRCYIHACVEEKSRLFRSENTSFHFILEDESSEIKVNVVGALAEYYYAIIKEGTWFLFENFIVKNNPGNDTRHKYEIYFQNFSIVRKSMLYEIRSFLRPNLLKQAKYIYKNKP